MHVLEISAKLQNAEIFPVTLLKSVSITDAHPTISKILGTIFAMESVSVWLWSVN